MFTPNWPKIEKCHFYFSEWTVQEVQKVFDALDPLFRTMTDQMSTAFKGKQLVVDRTWMRKMGQIAAEMKSTSHRFKELQAPARYLTVQQDLIATADAFQEADRLFTAAPENVDANDILDLTQPLSDGARYIFDAKRKLKSMDSSSGSGR